MGSGSRSAHGPRHEDQAATYEEAATPPARDVPNPEDAAPAQHNARPESVGSESARPAHESAAACQHGLSERDTAVLDLERRGHPSGGAKERMIREHLDMSPTRYYQLVNALLDDPRALRHDPVTVNRLRRIRDDRRARR